MTRLGYLFREQPVLDVGLDAHIERGEADRATGELIGLQIKGGPSWLNEIDGNHFVHRPSRRHGDYWRSHTLPVLVCLCDPATDTVYWQVVTAETLVETGTNYKIHVPFSNTLSDPSAAGLLAEHSSQTVPLSQYAVQEESDKSHGLAKRCSLKVTLNCPVTRATVASIVRQVTSEARNSTHHRSDLSREAWEGRETNIVWTFVYPTPDDLASNNYFCRAIWVSEEQDRASLFGTRGENIGQGVTCQWNDSYESTAGFIKDRRLTKGEFLISLNRILDLARPVLHELATDINSMIHEQQSQAFLDHSQPARSLIDDLYVQSGNIGFAPYECLDADGLFHSFMAELQNLSLYYSQRGLAMWPHGNRQIQSKRSIGRAQQHLAHLEYELKKLH